MKVEDVITNLKASMLGQSAKIACHGCDKNYCCVNQQRIEISKLEFEQIKPHITDEQYKRAKYEIDNSRIMNGFTVYTCPFNNPDTGMCEIYENRFVVCATHGVVADDIEACNTEASNKGTFIVNPIRTFEIACEDEATMAYMMHLATDEPTDILEAFRLLT